MEIGLDLGALGGAGLSSIMNMITTGYWNRKQMEREDTAVQRQMADLKAAGINPLMAANTNGASTGNYQAPQLDSNLLANAMSSQLKYQLGEQKEAYKQAQLTTKFMENQYNDSLLDRDFDDLDYFGLFGKHPTRWTFNYDKNGKLGAMTKVIGISTKDYDNTPAQRYLNTLDNELEAQWYASQSGMNYNKWFNGLASDNFYATEMTLDKIAQFIPGVSGLANAFANMYKSVRGSKNYNYSDNHNYNNSNVNMHHYRHY